MPRGRPNKRNAGEVVKIRKFVCGGCGKANLSGLDDEAPEGYHGEVSQITSFGRTDGFFYACSNDCLVNAIWKATTDKIEEDDL